MTLPPLVITDSIGTTSAGGFSTTGVFSTASSAGLSAASRRGVSCTKNANTVKYTLQSTMKATSSYFDFWLHFRGNFGRNGCLNGGGNFWSRRRSSSCRRRGSILVVTRGAHFSCGRCSGIVLRWRRCRRRSRSRARALALRFAPLWITSPCW